MIDIDNNKVYATYTGPASMILAPTLCHVKGNKCKNAAEFQDMTYSYMKE